MYTIIKYIYKETFIQIPRWVQLPLLSFSVLLENVQEILDKINIHTLPQLTPLEISIFFNIQMNSQEYILFLLLFLISAKETFGVNIFLSVLWCREEDFD